MKPIHSFDELYRALQLRKVPFFITFFIVIIATYALLYVIDFYPEPVTEEAKKEVAVEEMEVVQAPEVEEAEAEEAEAVPEVESVDPLPVSIYFDKFDKEVNILNPTSADYEVLDDALLKGAVRHPQSADFTEEGNIFVMAHSSYLPNVLNKNFQAFNDIQKLSWGDTIRLRSEDTEYIYRVQKVYEDKASELFVPFTPGESRLTLATCNVLGAKEDRYMVEAQLVTKIDIEE